MKICNATGCGVCCHCDGNPPITNGYLHGDICRKTVENIMNHLESGGLYRFRDGKLYELDADIIDMDEIECDI